MAEPLPAVYREVLASMPDSVVVVDGEGQIVFVNSATEELTGHSRGNLIGNPIESLLPGDRRGAHRRQRSEYQRHPSVRRMGRDLDIKLVRAAGDVLDVDVALSPITIDRRNMVVAAVRDISDRRRIEEELRESRETLERLIDGVSEYAILMLDPEGLITSWNRGAEQLEGYTAEEVLGRHIGILYTPADRAAGLPDENLEEALRTGRADIEGWRVRKDGSRYWASTVIAPVFDETGQLRGFSKVTRDMSGRRRAQMRVQAGLTLSEATLRERPARTLLLLLARAARALTGAPTVTVSTPAAAGEEVEITIALGPEAARLRGVRAPIPSFNPTNAGPRAIEVNEDTWQRFLPVRPRELPQRGVVVPVMAREEVRAVVTILGGSRPTAYAEADLQALGLLASQAAIALDYGRGRAALRQIALVEDRERIARELHDGVIQAIFGIGLNLQAAAATTADPALAARLDDAVGRLDDVVRDLRTYIFELRPGMLAELQLDRAIRRLVGDLESASGITFTLDLDPAAAGLLTGRATDVLALVNELLSNIRRHSGATSASLTLTQTGSAVRLELRDNGRGFEVDGPGSGGQGL
ncbi:MAG: PAS domain S-box protein, partial [Candidatus Dormibacteraeota bacterium]|nr:PAS domain S-box protein [Candidatus Dormibacteraeota bacterium]